MTGDSEPLVSVVIPAYNAGSTIKATIISVLNQTLSDIEVLVIDDGSTDNTADIVAAFSDTDKRISIIRSVNQGVARARNLGIEKSRGQYIAFVDADDIWHQTKLEKQCAFLQQFPTLGIVYCLSDRID